MTYNTPQQKQQIRIEIKKLLAEHEMNLSEYCRKFGLNYNVVYANIFTYAEIQHDFIGDFIRRLDWTKSLKELDGKLVITKP